MPPTVFDELDSTYVLNHYVEPTLFPLVIPEDANASEYSVVPDTEVLGFTVTGKTIANLSEPVRLTFQSLRGRRGEVISMIHNLLL